MKKNFLFIGTVLLTTPVLTLISCGQNNNINQNKTKSNNQDFKINNPWYADFTENDVKNNNFQVPIDGIYLVKESYDGKFWEGFGDNGQEIKHNVSYMWGKRINDSVVELGNNDSFYVLFNNDDNDGLKADDFEKIFFFNDTSLMMNSDMEDIYNLWGLKENPFWNPNSFNEMKMLIPFQNGRSIPWIGTQSNHANLTFEQAMNELKEELKIDEFNKIENYYKTSSHFFKPTLIKEGMFTYNRVSKNAYKITYHYDENRPRPITAAGFKLINFEKNINNSMQTFSLGDKNEWNAYESKNSNYKFLGRK